MTRGPIIFAEGVGKLFGRRSLAAFLARRGKRPLRTGRGERDQVIALEGLDLTLERGESLGVIGSNGAGKSTLLRLVAGLARPSWGRLEVRGEVRSLLDLGAGFVEDLTGRENALSLLGVDGVAAERRPKVAAEALEFAGIGRFVEEPVRSYSAGMRLRLAYALAIALPADLLVTDEVLAVGDEDFQRRCAGHVSRFLGSGGSLLLASHNLYHVEKLCHRAIWLHQGRVRAYGPARHVTASYRAEVEEEFGGEGELAARGEREHGLAVRSAADVGSAETAAIEVSTTRGCGVRRIAEGESVEISVRPPAGEPGRCKLEILRAGTCVATLTLPRGRARIERWPFLPGRYRIRIVDCGSASRAEPVGIEVETLGTSRDFGTVRLEHTWD